MLSLLILLNSPSSRPRRKVAPVYNIEVATKSYVYYKDRNRAQRAPNFGMTEWLTPEAHQCNLQSNQKVPAARVLSSPSGEAAVDNVEERVEFFWPHGLRVTRDGQTDVEVEIVFQIAVCAWSLAFMFNSLTILYPSSTSGLPSAWITGSIIACHRFV